MTLPADDVPEDQLPAGACGYQTAADRSTGIRYCPEPTAPGGTWCEYHEDAVKGW